MFLILLCILQTLGFFFLKTLQVFIEPLNLYLSDPEMYLKYISILHFFFKSAVMSMYLVLFRVVD